MSVQDMFSIVKDIIVSLVACGTCLAAIVTAGVAVYGIATWRRELDGKKKLDVATRVARKVHEIRDRINDARLWPVCPSEEAIAIAEAIPNIQDFQEVERQAIIYDAIFFVRIKPLQEAMEDLRSLTWETELLWEEEITNSLVPLWAKIDELFGAQVKHASAQRSGRSVEGTMREDRLVWKIAHKIGDPGTGDDQDHFGYELDKIVENITSLLREKVKIKK